MGDNFANYGRDGRGDFSEIPSRFSVPPPNFQPPGNVNKNPRQWDAPPGDGYKGNSTWNTGGYNDNFGSVNENHGKGNFRRENRGIGNGGGNKDGYNKGYGGGGSDMIIQEDTIFVSGMDPSITEQDIHNHFGAIGIIKKDKKTMKPKIWLYKHKDTGVSKGEATVTYDDVNAAKSAISWFDGRDFNGSTVKVSLAQRQNTWNKSAGGGGGKGNFGGPRGGSSAASGGDRGFYRDFERNSGPPREDRGSGGRPNSGGQIGNSRGGGGGGGGGSLPQREGDWKCSECNNTNFAWRNECNRCKAPKRETSSYDSNPSKGPVKQPNFADGRRNFKGNNRGGMHQNFAQRDETERNSNNLGSDFSGGFSGMNNRRDGGPVRNTNDRGGRMRPY